MTVSTYATTKDTSQKETLFGFKAVLIALAGSAFLALSAQFAVHLPFAPVPITLQTFAVLMLAATLGPRLAALSCLAYLVEGTLGMPVFAHGAIAPLWFLTPRVGYVLGFVASAYTVGTLSEKQNHLSFVMQTVIFAIGEGVVLLSGWLGLLCFLSPADAAMTGVAPFVIGAVLKALCASSLVRGFRALKG